MPLPPARAVSWRQTMSWVSMSPMPQPPPWKKTCTGSRVESGTPAGRYTRSGMAPSGPSALRSRTAPICGAGGVEAGRVSRKSRRASLGDSVWYAGRPDLTIRSMTFAAWGSSAIAQHLAGLLFDHRAAEEIRVHLAPEAHGVGEHEVLEVVVVDEAVLDQLVRLRHHVGHVGHVEVADVRREDRVQPRAHRVRLLVERPRVDRVVGLAAEVEARHEQLLEVLLLLDLAAEVIIDVLDAARHGLRLVQPLAAADRLRHLLAPVLARELEQPRAVELGGMRGLDRLPVALLPVADEVRVEHARPAHAALEEGEVQVREATRDAAEEDPLAHRVTGRGEVADVVEAEVRGRVAQQDRARAVVERGRELQLAALLPHGIVVVVAVDPDDVEPLGELRGLGLLLGHRGHGPAHEAADHDDLEAELGGRELQLFDRLLRRVHRDDRGRDDAIGVRLELLGREHVVRAADGAAHPRVLQPVE